MKRRRLVALVSAVTLLAAVFIAVVTIGIGVGTNPGREQIRSLIQSQVSSRVHGKIHIGRVTGGMLTGFTLDTFAIRGLDDSLLVSTGKISVQYDPRDLLDKRLLLRNVEVEHPFIRLRQYEHDWNFQRIFASSGPQTPDVPGRSFGDFIVLDSVRVKDAKFTLILPWGPDDTLTGAKRDSAIRVNLANKDREIRRSADGLTHVYRWTHASGFLSHVRLADPDSDRFGQEFVVEAMRVDESDPPFLFRNVKGRVRRLHDSVFVNLPHFELPGSAGNATGKIWWGGPDPIRLDLRIHADTVALRDVAWIYPTLPREGGGSTNLHIYNNIRNKHILEYALTNMDVRSARSHLMGDMTFVVGGPVLVVQDVNLRAAPVNFDLVRVLAGAPLPVDWQGDLFGIARGPGGPLTHFILDTSDVTWRDSHVAGAVSHFNGSGELDILEPAKVAFHDFDVVAQSLDLRSVQFLFPGFPRLGGTITGEATLDSSWLDVRFSNANVVHRNGPGEPTRVIGSGRVTYGDNLRYDVAVTASPLSLTMISRAYPLSLKGLMSGPIRAKGVINDLQLTMDLSGPAGRLTYNGKVDGYPLSVAARGTGRVERMDVSKLVATTKKTLPTTSLTGTYQLDVRGDTNDLGTLRGSAMAQLERSEFDGNRIFGSRLRARFANGRIYVDTMRIESVAATLTAQGALGLTQKVADSLTYLITVDSLGGLRQYVTKIASALQRGADSVASDSLGGALTLSGSAHGSLRSMDISGAVRGDNVFVRKEAGREIMGSFALSNVFTGPSGAATLRFAGVTIAGVALDSLDAAIHLEAGKTGTFNFGAWEKRLPKDVKGVTLTGFGDLTLRDTVASLVVRDVALVTDHGRWSLRGASNIVAMPHGFSIDSLVLENGAGGRATLSALVPDAGRARMVFRADSVPLRDIRQIAQIKKELAGWATVTAQGAGTRLAPVVNMQATLNDVAYGTMKLQRVSATAEYLNKRAAVSLDLVRGTRTALLARGSLPMELSYFGIALSEDSLQGTIRTDSATFDIIEAFIPQLTKSEGRLVANVDVSGTWKHPDLSGQITVADGKTTIDALGVTVQGVNVDVGLFGHADSLSVRRLVGWSGNNSGDSISLRGYVKYDELDNPTLNLRLDARTFHALDKRTLARLDISTEPDGVRLRGALLGATLTGGLIVDRGTVFLPDPELARKQNVDLSSPFASDSAKIGTRPSEGASNLMSSLVLDGLSVRLGDDVWLRSREANIKLAGTLNVQRSIDRRTTTLAVGRDPSDTLEYRPALEGALAAERGTYTLSLAGVVQREFQVQSGTITFFGSSELEPELNIGASHTVRAQNGSDIRILVRLTGPLSNPIVSLESGESFAMSQSDMVSYLIFGQQSFELTNNNQDLIKVAAQTLFPTFQTIAQSQLSRLLPFADFIQLRPGSTDAAAAFVGTTNPNENFTNLLLGSRVAAEKQIGDKLYVSLSTGICSFKAQDGQSGNDQWLDIYNGLSGKIEWRLSHDAAIKAGKEPSTGVGQCGRSSGRLVSTPTQWGLSFFKTWRF